MAQAGPLTYIYLSRFSKPKAQRWLYREIRRRRIARILELGIGTGERASRMLSVARRYAQGHAVHYTGIDSFEGRPSPSPSLTIRDAYRMLKPSGARVQLFPGDPFPALSRLANGLLGTQLIILSAQFDDSALDRAWFYVPRMLVNRSLVLREACEGQDEYRLRVVAASQIESLARPSRTRSAA